MNVHLSSNISPGFNLKTGENRKENRFIKRYVTAIIKKEDTG